MGMSETQMLNQIWFEIHGGDKVKEINKDISDALKQMKRDSDLAQESIDKVVKKWTTLAQTPKNMSNISSAVYSNREKRQITNWSRNTHSTPKYLASDYYNEGTVDYSAARTAWKSMEADRRKQAKLQSDITRFLEEGKSIMQESARIDKEINEQKRKIAEATAKKAQKTAKEMTEYQKNKIRVEDERTSISAQRARTEAEEAARRTREFNETSNIRAYKNAHPELFAVGGLYHNKKYQAGHMLQTLGGVSSTLGSGGRAVGLALDSLGAFFKAVPLGIATTISNLAKGIVELGKAAVQAYAEIESIKTQLGVVFSNQTQADAMFGNISQYAVKSPFGVQQTSELAVLLKQSGVYASDLMDTLRMLGDTAGGNMEKMKRIANNYAQIVSIGKASMLDMRQFAYAGIPIFEAVSKELGVSQQELRKLISDGKVTSDIIEKVFKDLTGINGIFENATEKGAKTLKARLQNLSDAKQLALGSLGERVVNAGSKNGNDGVITQFVSTAEDFFTWMKEHNDIANIERDVNLIANSNTRIKALEELLKTAKETGDKDLAKIIEEELNYQKNIFDVDKRRAVYSESYDIKNAKYNRYKEKYGDLTEDELNKRLEETKDKLAALLSTATSQNVAVTGAFMTGGGGLSYNPYAQKVELTEDAKLQRDIYQQLIKDLGEYQTALEAVKKTTEDEVKANRERNLVNRQQESYDSMSKAADKEGSYSAAFDKLFSIETQSEEYKQKKEQEEIAFLKEAQNVLKSIAGFVDEEGKLDMTKFSYAEFSNLYNNKKAFNPDNKLQIVEGNKKATEENRRILLEQWGDMSDKIFTELEKDRRGRGFRSAQYSQILNGTDDSTFFDRFSKVLTEQLAYLDELKKAASSDEMKKYYDDMAENLIASTFRLGVNTNGMNANLDAMKKGTTQEFIPLWKRILSGATGLTTNGMTSTQQTMTNYRDDMAIRNMASGVLSATMRSMGIDSAMSLMRTNRSVQLTGDSGKTYQIDWAETKKAMHNFATQLSASTEVVSAYKKGLEEELDVYQQLIAAGYTQAESTDLGSQKFVSSKQLAKLGLGNESQLVNAFGEVLTTASGKKYNVADVSFENGKMFDKAGNEIEEQVVITGKLFEFIRSELPRIYTELEEANSAELNNAVLADMYKKIASTDYINSFVKRNGYGQNAAMLLSRQEYAQSFIDAQLNLYKNRRDDDGTLFHPELSKLDNSTIYLRARQYEMNRTEYQRLINEKRDKANSGLITTNWADQLNEEADALEKELAEMRESFYAVDRSMKAMDESIGKVTNSNDFETMNDISNTMERDMNVISELLSLAALAKNRQAGNLGVTADGQVITSSTAIKPEDYGGARGFRNKVLKNVFGVDMGYDIEDLYLQAARTENLKGQNVNQFGINANDYVNKTDDYILKNLSKQEKAWIRITEAQKQSAETLMDISNKTESLMANFMSDAFTSTFQTWGECLAKGDDASKGIADNMRSLTATLMQNMGAMITQAGLSLAASSWGDKAGVLAGLAIAAAGGGLSFLGGYLNGMGKDDNDKDKDYEKLLKIKQDLSDLLKQAREDAIYYENTVRHKKAISANDELTQRNVHDAIITPRGEVVNTDPRDYLIATKTPRTLVGGGAPTINFNVVDKSTGIRVTQQSSTYNEETNTIEFEAIIESKVQEIIASPKGDEAFSAREARLRGRTVIA